MTVLILGNGISRTAFDKQIREYPGEVWACNYAYRDFPDKITRLTGHDFALVDAQKEKEANGWAFDIYAGVCAKKRPEWETSTQPPQWLRDSGSSLATMALHEGYDIICCGFDMGGADLYSPDHWQQNKTSWVRRWAEILMAFGPERVTFWGYDHKPFLLDVASGKQRPDKYFKLYRGNKPHLLESAEYIEEHERRFGVFKPRSIEMVRVKYNNGYETICNRKIADILLERKEVEEVEVIKPERESVIAANTVTGKEEAAKIAEVAETKKAKRTRKG